MIACGRGINMNRNTPPALLSVHCGVRFLLAQVNLAAGPDEDGLFFQVLVGDLCPELGDLLLQVWAAAQAQRGKDGAVSSKAAGEVSWWVDSWPGVGGWQGAHLPLFLGQCLVRALPCAASCSCAKRKRFMSGEAPCARRGGRREQVGRGCLRSRHTGRALGCQLSVTRRTASAMVLCG